MKKIKTLPSILPPTKRIIAIGDLHGDYRATLLALRKANLIDSKNRWSGGNTIIVQVGDQLDRGGRQDNYSDEDSEFKIMNIMNRLHNQAIKQGGAVYSLLGNHELMNVLGDFDYTSSMGLGHFGNKKERYINFKPGGKIACKMACTRNVIMKIGDIVFVHGGINPKIANKYRFDDINLLMRKFLLGDTKLQYNNHFRDLFLNENSLLWSRQYSDIKPNCPSLYKSLDSMNAKLMIVGHTPQDNGINCKCNAKVWRIDTGMSQAFGRRNGLNRIEVLEILNNGTKMRII